MLSRRSIGFAGNASLLSRTRFVSVLLLIILSFGLVPLHGVAQTGAGELIVTYVSVGSATVVVGTTVVVIFRVCRTSEDPYLGEVCNPATDLQTGSFIFSPEGMLLTSMLGALASSQASEHLDVPLFPGELPGEYRAVIQTGQNDPIGNILVYVKAESLQVMFKDVLYTGPRTNVSSVQTPDTSDDSVVAIKQIEQPSVWTQLLQGNTLLLLVLAALIVLVLLISIIARRKRKPAPTGKQ